MNRIAHHSRAVAWTTAGAIAIVAWWINHRAPILVAAPSCAGLGEWIAMLASRLAPHQSIGTIVRAMDVVSDLIAVALVTRIATATSRSLLGGAAIGLACARLFAFTPLFAVTDALALAAAAATLLALFRAGSASNLSTRALPWIGVALSIAIAGLLPASSHFALPATPGAALLQVGDGLHLAFATISPFVVGLTVLGAVAASFDSATDARVGWFAGYAGAAIVLSAISIAPPARVLAPALVSAVALAGMGLATFRAAVMTPPTALRRVADAAVLLALVFVHLPPSIPPPMPIAGETFGVDQLSRASFNTLRGALPAGATLVDDDALVRLLADGSRTPWIAAAPDFVRDAAGRGPVIALPPAQGALVHEGFSLEPIDAIDAVGITGLARVTSRAACAPARAFWREADGLAGTASIAFVAPTTDARGPIVAYLSATAPFSPAPRGWPAIAMRGWYTTIYDRSKPDQSRALATDMASDDVPANESIGTAPYVARLELWRVPDAPLILDVALGTPATAATVRAKNASDPAHVQLCPSAPVTIAPLVIPRSILR